MSTMPVQTSSTGVQPLQRLQLCVSYAALLNVLDESADGHDEKVTEWQETLQSLIRKI